MTPPTISEANAKVAASVENKLSGVLVYIWIVVTFCICSIVDLCMC